MSPIFKKFRQDIIAIIFLAAGLFMALALASYSPQDPSLNALGSGLRSANYCGIAGSFLADLCYQFFGLTAWVMVVGALSQAWSSFQGENFRLKDFRFVWGFLFIIALATLTGLYFPKTKLFQGQIFPGGLLGLSTSQALVRVFNPIGVQVIMWCGLMMLAVFYSEKTLQELARIPLGGFEKLRGIQWWAAFKEKAEKVSAKKKVDRKPVILPEEKKRPVFTMKEDSRILETAVQQTLPSPEFDEPSLEEELPEIPGARRRVVLKAKPPKRIENWKMPGISLLEDPPASRWKIDREEHRRKAELLTEKLLKFKIEGQIVDAKPGPLVTQYEFRPNADVKISEISNLEDDLSLALSSESVRVMGQIPGTDVVGIETANSKRETVYYKDLLAEEEFWKTEVALPIALGKQANGEPKIVNLRPMPHLLIAGTTGSGKSVFVRSIITGLLFRHSPKTLRLIFD